MISTPRFADVRRRLDTADVAHASVAAWRSLKLGDLEANDRPPVLRRGSAQARRRKRADGGRESLRRGPTLTRQRRALRNRRAATWRGIASVYARVERKTNS